MAFIFFECLITLLLFLQLWYVLFPLMYGIKVWGIPLFSRLNLLKPTLHFKDTHNTCCHICPLAKQRRLSFPAHNHVAENVFDLIHCDIWGSFSTQTHAGFSYFVTLVDDCSRFTWIYLLKSKGDVLHISPRFFKLVETQFAKVIKTFQL